MAAGYIRICKFAPMSKYTPKDLFELFKKQYHRKYDFISDAPLGDGGYV